MDETLRRLPKVQVAIPRVRKKRERWRVVRSLSDSNETISLFRLDEAGVEDGKEEIYGGRGRVKEKKGCKKIMILE